MKKREVVMPWLKTQETAANMEVANKALYPLAERAIHLTEIYNIPASAIHSPKGYQAFYFFDGTGRVAYVPTTIGG